MTADPKPQRATTREEMVEALLDMVPDRDSKPRILTGAEGQALIDLASRLPSPPAASECRVAHEATEAVVRAARALTQQWRLRGMCETDRMVEAGELQHAVNALNTERARVAQAAPKPEAKPSFKQWWEHEEAAAPAEPAAGEGVGRRSCNMHTDCGAADDRAIAAGRQRPDHCHDDCCPDCFGN